MYFSHENNNSKILLNIPHSSTLIPKEYINDYLLNKEELSYELKVMADLFTSEIYKNNNVNFIEAEYSRIFTDIERFREDKDETMFKKGMGVLYTKSSRDKDLRKIFDPEQMKNDFYDKYHQKFLDMSNQILNNKNELIIIDCHSFPEKKQPYQLCNDDTIFPDICIGFDQFHKDDEIIKLIEKKFTNLNYSVILNSPYSGSIVPLDMYNKDVRVKSIMIEINRRTYMNSITFDKTNNFNTIQTTIQELIQEINNR